LLIPPHFGIVRLMVGCHIALIYLLALIIIKPYQNDLTGIIAVACSFSVVVMFIGVIPHKVYAEATSGLGLTGTATLSLFEEGSLFTIVLLSFNVGGIVLLVIIFFRVIGQTAHLRTMRLESDGSRPKLSLAETMQYHAFISHAWADSQDQAALLKRMLQLLLPGAQIFLDVDDLEDESQLERHVNESALLVIFVSKAYLSSKNCERELRAALTCGKPLVGIFDNDRNLLCDIENEYSKSLSVLGVFEKLQPWLRHPHFQLATLKYVSEKLLLATPGFARNGTNLKLYVPGELLKRQLFLSSFNRGSRPIKVKAFPANDGVECVLEELKLIQGIEQVSYDEDVHALFILYLNKYTFIDGTAKSIELTRQIRQMAETEKPCHMILCVHERDSYCGACAFGKIISCTPAALRAAGLYTRMAIPWLSLPNHRPVSIHLIVQALQQLQHKEKSSVRSSLMITYAMLPHNILLSLVKRRRRCLIPDEHQPSALVQDRSGDMAVELT